MRCGDRQGMSRWGTVWTESEIDAYLRDFKAKNRPADRTAKLEPNPRHAIKAKNAAKETHPRFRMQFTHRSKKRADPGNRCYKWVVDGIVQAGILGDDSWEWITEIRESEEKSNIEQTLIELYEIVEK